MPNTEENERFASRLARLRESAGISIEALSELTGVSPGTIDGYETGYTEPMIGFLEAAARVFGVPLSYIALFSDESTLREPDGMCEIFIMSKIRKDGIARKSDIVGTAMIKRELLRTGDYFAFLMTDDSMSGARICQGDLVVVRRTKSITSGDVVVAIVGGETLVRRYKKLCGKHYLIAADRSYAPLEVKAEDFPKVIYGKVEEVRINMSEED